MKEHNRLFLNFERLNFFFNRILNFIFKKIKNMTLKALKSIDGKGDNVLLEYFSIRAVKWVDL